jgi:hypothetical protein
LTDILRKAGRATLAVGLAALATGFAGGKARAQFVEPASRYDFSVRVGTLIPGDDDVRRAGGTHNLSIEVDYIVQRFPSQSLFSTVSLGFIERDGFRLVPATIGLTKREYSDDLRKTYYYGIGGGLYQARVVASDTSGENKWIPGGYFQAGIDLTPRVYTEFRYLYVNKYDGKFVGGSQLSVGFRF